jgi:hypothetical protein
MECKACPDFQITTKKKNMRNRILTLAAVIIGMVLPALSHAGAPASAIPDSLKQGLVLYYDFDPEPFDGKVIDKSDAHNDGTVVNVDWVRDNHRGSVASFGLKKSYITVPNTPHLTLSAWIKTSYEDSSWRRILEKGSVLKGYNLTMCGGQGWRGQVGMDVAPAACDHSGQPYVTDGQWHHVVGTFDGVEKRIYVDDVLRSSRDCHFDASPTAYDLTIGANRSNPWASLGQVDVSFNGLMDDVMMWNRALSVDEVKTLFSWQGGVLASQPAPSTPAAPGTQDSPFGVAVPNAAPPVVPTNGETASTTAKLKTLKDAYDQGLITKEVYDQKVKEVLDGM